MRFAIVGPAPPLRGGIAQHTERLASILRGEHEVDVYPYARQYPRLLFPGRSQIEPAAGASAGGRQTFDPYRPRSWQRVAADIVARAPDLVLVQWWHPWFALPLGALLSRLRRGFGGERRIAIVCHNALPHQPVPFERRLSRHVLRRAGRILVHAESEAARLRELIGDAVPVEQAGMPCLAPTAAAPARDMARRRHAAGSAPLILFFGLVRAHKGLADLIAALPLMRCHDARLLVAGEFYEPRRRYERQIAALGLTGRVTLRDAFVPDDELPALFVAADVVALPYRRATQSAVLPLAVHYRKRFVVTRAGGLPEAAQGLAGIVAPQDPAALAAALDAALAAGPIEDQPGELERWRRAADAFGVARVRADYVRIATAAAGASTAPVTVVVAAHGACPHLEATLDALARQRGAPEFELLVVHDGQGSELAQRLATVDAPRLRLLGDAGAGLNAKRNRGIDAANTDRILFTDDDCVPDPDWVRALADALDRHPVVTGRVLPLGPGTRASLRESDRPRRFRGPLDAVLAWRAGCGNNLGVRRSVFTRLGAFEPRIGVGTWSGAACDTEFLFRVLRSRGGEVQFVPAAVVRHRQEPLGADVLAKRRRYYRGVSFLARRIHPGSAAAWSMAALRLGGIAVVAAWAALRFDRDARRIHAAELHGAVEGLFGPAPNVLPATHGRNHRQAGPVTP